MVSEWMVHGVYIEKHHEQVRAGACPRVLVTGCMIMIKSPGQLGGFRSRNHERGFGAH